VILRNDGVVNDFLEKMSSQSWVIKNIQPKMYGAKPEELLD
jgi:hypothetical protein